MVCEPCRYAGLVHPGGADSAGAQEGEVPVNACCSRGKSLPPARIGLRSSREKQECRSPLPADREADRTESNCWPMSLSAMRWRNAVRVRMGAASAWVRHTLRPGAVPPRPAMPAAGLLFLRSWPGVPTPKRPRRQSMSLCTILRIRIRLIGSHAESSPPSPLLTLARLARRARPNRSWV